MTIPAYPLAWPAGWKRTATREDARAAYRRLAAQHHPDKGGDPARMAEINQAWDQAREVVA
jgi:curved DNA-binding protein CbpA